MTEAEDDDNPGCISAEQRAAMLRDGAARGLPAKEAVAIRTGNPMFHVIAIYEARAHGLPEPPASAEYLTRALGNIVEQGRKSALEPDTPVDHERGAALLMEAMGFSRGKGSPNAFAEFQQMAGDHELLMKDGFRPLRKRPAKGDREGQRKYRARLKRGGSRLGTKESP